MSNYKLIRLATRNALFISGYGKFLNIEDEFIMGDGILINKKGQVIWNTAWKHSFFNAVYVKNKNLLLTDRFQMIGGTISIGICCIDMLTGKYKWKHFYDNSAIQRIEIRKKQPNVNLVKGIGKIDLTKGEIFTDGFKINIDDGDYQYIGQTNVKYKKDENIIRPMPIKSFRVGIDHSKTPIVNFSVRDAQIGNTQISKAGYFFNKCDIVINTNNFIYFFVVPEKKNLQGTKLLKYSKKREVVEVEFELPFRFAPYGVYDFFQRGIMIYANSSNMNNLWLIENIDD